MYKREILLSASVRLIWVNKSPLKIFKMRTHRTMIIAVSLDYDSLLGLVES